MWINDFNIPLLLARNLNAKKLKNTRIKPQQAEKWIRKEINGTNLQPLTQDQLRSVLNGAKIEPKIQRGGTGTAKKAENLLCRLLKKTPPKFSHITEPHLNIETKAQAAVRQSINIVYVFTTLVTNGLAVVPSQIAQKIAHFPQTQMVQNIKLTASDLTTAISGVQETPYEFINHAREGINHAVRKKMRLRKGKDTTGHNRLVILDNSGLGIHPALNQNTVKAPTISRKEAAKIEEIIISNLKHIYKKSAKTLKLFLMQVR